MEDDAILALVTRLARPHPSGGEVIERAAILAAGSDFGEIMEWITAHDGKPEAPPAAKASAGGLHGARFEGGGSPDRAPARFVLPPGALA